MESIILADRKSRSSVVQSARWMISDSRMPKICSRSVPAFVLTHYARPPLAMRGGTEFRFVTGGIHDALAQAKAAAGGRDVRLGGGVATVREYLRAALVDDLHLAVGPVLLGAGEHLMHGLDLRALGYECTKQVAGERATHVFLRKRA